MTVYEWVVADSAIGHLKSLFKQNKSDEIKQAITIAGGAMENWAVKIRQFEAFIPIRVLFVVVTTHLRLASDRCLSNLHFNTDW